MTARTTYPLAPARDDDRHDYELAIDLGDWVAADDLLDGPCGPLLLDDLTPDLGVFPEPALIAAIRPNARRVA